MYYLLLLFFARALAGEWIDPHDMNVESNTKVWKLEKYKTSLDCNCSEDIAFIYLKRIVSLLLSSTTLEQENSSILKGIYFFDKEKDYNFLEKFSVSEKIDAKTLKELDTIIRTAFNKKISDDVLEILDSTKEKFTKLFNMRTLILLAVSLALYIFYYLIRTNFTFWYTLRYFLFIILIVDYGYRYQILLEVILNYLIWLIFEKNIFRRLKYTILK